MLTENLRRVVLGKNLSEVALLREGGLFLGHGFVIDNSAMTFVKVSKKKLLLFD